MEITGSFKSCYEVMLIFMYELSGSGAFTLEFWSSSVFTRIKYPKDYTVKRNLLQNRIIDQRLQNIHPNLVQSAPISFPFEIESNFPSKYKQFQFKLNILSQFLHQLGNYVNKMKFHNPFLPSHFEISHSLSVATKCDITQPVTWNIIHYYFLFILVIIITNYYWTSMNAKPSQCKSLLNLFTHCGLLIIHSFIPRQNVWKGILCGKILMPCGDFDAILRFWYNFLRLCLQILRLCL